MTNESIAERKAVYRAFVQADRMHSELMRVWDLLL